MGKRSRGGWYVVGGFILVTVALATIWSTQETGEEMKRRSVDREISLTGELESESARVSEKARLETSAEENVTRVHVTAARRDDSVRAPIVDVVLSNGTRCQTPRSWLWPSRDGGELTLVCSRFLVRSEADAVATGVVSIFDY